VNLATPLFADTAFWIGLLNRRDQHHRQALAWNQYLVANSISIVTTEAVLWEWLNGCSSPSIRQRAAQGYRRCRDDSQLDVVEFYADLNESAVRLFERRDDKEWSLTDCLSFVVMEDRQLTDALTTDYHFEQAGFRTLLLSTPPST
jgi:predicted nucleic acid-binding protein